MVLYTLSPFLAWQHLTVSHALASHCVFGMCLACVWGVLVHACDPKEISVLQASPP